MKIEYPPFSVLMSLYIKEQPDYLDQCLESLHTQSIQASEIVIVLDGPITQNLKEVLDNWENKLPLVLLPQSVNRGLGFALNIGLEACSHEYIFRMDTDDICFASRFEIQMSFLVSNQEVDILGCFVEEFETIPKDLKQIKKAPTKDKIDSYIKLRNPINHMGVAYKKSKILNSGGYKDLLFMEDYYLWIRAHSNGLIIDNLQHPLVHARIGNGMLQRRMGKEYIKSEKKLAKIKYELLKTTPIETLFIYLARAAIRSSSPIINLAYKLIRKI